MPDEYLLHELVSCILSSRVRYETSFYTLQNLIKHKVLDLGTKRSGNEYIKILTRILKETITTPKGNKFRYTFPNTKAKCISNTYTQIYLNNQSIKGILEESSDPMSARKTLIKYASGIGPKQASMFLRNIGFTDDIAILDTHILRFMEFNGLNVDKKQDVSSLDKYEKTERSLINHLSKYNNKISLIDTAIWILMRVTAQENVI
jgi:N-glycosylase/DNA lyase